MFESPRLSSSLRGLKALRRNSSAETGMDVDDVDEVAYILEQLRQQEDRQDDDTVILKSSLRGTDRTQIKEACFLVTIVGIGYLFPFSALTQPVDYWTLLFPDFNIEFPLTTIYMWTNLTMLTILVFFGGGGGKGGKNHPSHFTRRIVGGFVGQLLVLLIVPTSYFLHLEEHTNMIAILTCTAIAAIVTAFIDSAVISLVSQYPLRVQEFFQLGVGVSTLIGSLYRDATKLVFPADAIVASSLLYFYTGAITIVICIAAYYRLMTLPLSKACLAKASKATSETESNPSSHTTTSTDPSERTPLVPTKEDTSMIKKEMFSFLDPERYQVLRKVVWNEFMILLLFLSTLALWPPLVTEIPAYDQWTISKLDGTGWWPLILMTIFSCLDCLGRLFVRYRMGLNKDNIWMAVTIRFLLFPLIIAQVQNWGWWSSDIWSAILVGCLGFTNGYVGTLTIVLVNEVVETSAEQAIAGTFTSFFLNSGLVLGATIGMGFDAILSK